MTEPLYDMFREAMVEQHVAPVVDGNASLLDAFLSVKRHQFVPDGSKPFAYDNEAVPIGHEQMLSDPTVIGQVLALASIQPRERVLDVGSGSGYQMALVERLGAVVFGVEQCAPLAQASRKQLAMAGATGHVWVANGWNGLPEHSPFDVILCGAAVSQRPDQLLEQLRLGGRLVAPLGDDRAQKLTRWTRARHGWDVLEGAPVLFAPLLPNP